MTEYPNIDSCDPRQCVSGRIMRCSRIISSVFRRHLKPFNITNSQLTILFIITKTGGIIQQELANKLFMDKSTVNRNLKRLYEQKLIEKKEGTILITLNGKDKLESIIPHWEKAMTEIKLKLKDQGLQSLEYLTQTLTQ